MKKCVIILLAVCSHLLASCGSSGGGQVGAPVATQVQVEELLKEIQLALDIVRQRTAGTNIPQFNQAEVTLSTQYVSSNTTSGSLVLSVSASRTKTRGSTIALVMKPKNISLFNVRDKSRAGVQLANKIVAVMKAVDSQDNLDLAKLTISADLKVEKSLSSGIDIELYGVSIDGTKTSRSNTSTHTIKLIYGKP